MIIEHISIEIRFQEYIFFIFIYLFSVSEHNIYKQAHEEAKELNTTKKKRKNEQNKQHSGFSCFSVILTTISDDICTHYMIFHFFFKNKKTSSES